MHRTILRHQHLPYGSDNKKPRKPVRGFLLAPAETGLCSAYSSLALAAR